MSSTPQPDEWIAAYADNLPVEIDPADIEQFESTVDPRPANPLAEPAPPPTEDEQDQSALVSFVTANPDPSTWTTAQLRMGLEWLIRFELRRRGVV